MKNLRLMLAVFLLGTIFSEFDTGFENLRVLKISIENSYAIKIRYYRV